MGLNYCWDHNRKDGQYEENFLHLDISTLLSFGTRYPRKAVVALTGINREGGWEPATSQSPIHSKAVVKIELEQRLI
jgi:hypothetical protein